MGKNHVEYEYFLTIFCLTTLNFVDQDIKLSIMIRSQIRNIQPYHESVQLIYIVSHDGFDLRGMIQDQI